MDKIKKKYILCRLCGINLLSVLFGAAIIIFLSRITGMSLLLLNEEAFTPWCSYGMETVIFLWLYWIMFEFYKLHKEAIKVLPYRKTELFGVWVTSFKIISVFRVLFNAIGMVEEMEYCFSPYLISGKQTRELMLQCIGDTVFILFSASLDIIIFSLLIYKTMTFIENHRADAAFYIYIGIITVLCIIFGTVKSAAAAFIPMTKAAVIVYAVLFAASLIAGDIVISKLKKKIGENQ